MTSLSLIDPFHRVIDYLRVSVTDRCDLRCRYCMAEKMTFLPRSELLALEEIALIAERFIARGVTKIRLTGGEPLVRRDIMELVGALGAHIGAGLEELTITTTEIIIPRRLRTICFSVMPLLRSCIPTRNKRKISVYSLAAVACCKNERPVKPRTNPPTTTKHSFNDSSAIARREGNFSC